MGKDYSKFNRSLTFTNVVVGNKIYTFNGTDGKIDCGSDFLGITAISAISWIKLTSFGESGLGAIIDNGKFILRVNTTNSLLNFSSDGATFAASTNSSLAAGQWYHITSTRNTSGTANLYINGVLSGTANQSSGTPAAGSTNVIIGNDNGQTATLDGSISDVRIFNEVKSAQFILESYLKSRINY